MKDMEQLELERYRRWNRVQRELCQRKKATGKGYDYLPHFMPHIMKKERCEDCNAQATNICWNCWKAVCDEHSPKEDEYCPECEKEMDKEKVMSTWNEFEAAVGFCDTERCHSLGLEPDEDGGDGGFDIERLSELQEFCEANPQFHILTQISEGYVNREAFVNRLAYYLGDGSMEENIWWWYEDDAVEEDSEVSA